MNLRKFINSFKRKRAQLFLLINLTLIYILINISNYFQIFQLNKPYFEIQDSFTYVFVENSNQIGVFNRHQTCNPYKENATNFKIKLDKKYYPKILPVYHNETLNFTCLNSEPNIKTILLWNNFRGDPIFTYGEGVREPFKLHNCPVTNCELTTNRSKLNQSDFILFHMRSRISDFPPFRFDLQRWIYVVYESPQHCPMCNKLNGVFNLSATYKLDSDFTSIYLTDSALKWGFNPDFKVNDDFLGKKTKFSFTVISSCDASSRRLEYIEELKFYIDIDIYGKCSNDSNRTCIDNDSTICNKKLLSSIYKFYFAFENSICKDYVTEKFLKILHYNIVPVVLGDADYSMYAPRSAYINVFEFETPRDLAKYLIYLSNNKTAYNAYFKWKQWINVYNKNPFQAYICEMCIKLHLEKYTGIERKKLGDLNELMSMEKNCKGLKLTYIKKFEWSSLPQYLFMRYFES